MDCRAAPYPRDRPGAHVRERIAIYRVEAKFALRLAYHAANLRYSLGRANRYPARLRSLPAWVLKRCMRLRFGWLR